MTESLYHAQPGEAQDKKRHLPDHLVVVATRMPCTLCRDAPCVHVVQACSVPCFYAACQGSRVGKGD